MDIHAEDLKEKFENCGKEIKKNLMKHIDDKGGHIPDDIGRCKEERKTCPNAPYVSCFFRDAGVLKESVPYMILSKLIADDNAEKVCEAINRGCRAGMKDAVFLCNIDEGAGISGFVNCLDENSATNRMAVVIRSDGGPMSAVPITAYPVPERAEAVLLRDNKRQVVCSLEKPVEAIYSLEYMDVINRERAGYEGFDDQCEISSEVFDKEIDDKAIHSCQRTLGTVEALDDYRNDDWRFKSLVPDSFAYNSILPNSDDALFRLEDIFPDREAFAEAIDDLLEEPELG